METLKIIIGFILVIQFAIIFHIWLHELAYGKFAFTKKTYKKRWRGWIPGFGIFFLIKGIIY